MEIMSFDNFYYFFKKEKEKQLGRFSKISYASRQVDPQKNQLAFLHCYGTNNCQDPQIQKFTNFPLLWSNIFFPWNKLGYQGGILHN